MKRLVLIFPIAFLVFGYNPVLAQDMKKPVYREIKVDPWKLRNGNYPKFLPPFIISNLSHPVTPILNTALRFSATATNYS